MKSVDQHISDLLSLAKPLEPFAIPLLEAHGATLAEPLYSPVSLPPWNNSAMDGYAVRSAEVFLERPIPISGDVAAGASHIPALALGTAMRIMTGAPIPQGCDTVIPVELSREENEFVIFTQSVPFGANIRALGSDLVEGQLLLDANTPLNSSHIGIAAAVGCGSVLTRPHPRVVIISTGDELIEPGFPLAHGQIYDANTFLLTTAAREAGAIAYRVGPLPDNEHKLLEVIEDQLVRADLVVTSGGVSKGMYDTVKNVLSTLGTVTFESVAMQPGMPQGFGVIGPDSTPIVTLPGNPVSAYVSFELFVRPMIKSMFGQSEVHRTQVQATLTQPLKSPLGKRSFLRGNLALQADGYLATPVAGQGSHMLSGLSQANCLIIVPEQVESMNAGDSVQVIQLD